MDSILTELQQAVKHEAIEFAGRELGTANIDPVFDREGWGRCAAFGAMGRTIPEQYGGRGQSLNEFVAMMEGFGYASRRLGLMLAINAHVFGCV